MNNRMYSRLACSVLLTVLSTSAHSDSFFDASLTLVSKDSSGQLNNQSVLALEDMTRRAASGNGIVVWITLSQAFFPRMTEQYDERGLRLQDLEVKKSFRRLLRSLEKSGDVDQPIDGAIIAGPSTLVRVSPYALNLLARDSRVGQIAVASPSEQYGN